MAKISDIIFCNKALNIEGQGVGANVVLTTLSPEYIPGLFTFSVIITLIDIDPCIEHKVLIEFLGPNNEEVIRIEEQSPIIVDTSNIPAEYKGLTIAMDWNNVNLKVSGEYTIKVSVDDTVIGDKSIFVKGKNE